MFVFFSESKDVIYFTSPQDDDNIVEDKQKAPLPPDLGEAVGPSGEIDWDCPCLQGYKMFFFFFF